MNISSRTPEGRFNHCPVCGQEICIAPFEPTGDAPCPHCGVLLWFFKTVHGFAYFDRATSVESPPGLNRRIFSKDASVQILSAFTTGDHVRIREGTFESFEGHICDFDAEHGKIRVMIEIFGRRTPVEVEYWQVEPAK
jgi:hypothetical protein